MKTKAKLLVPVVLSTLLAAAQAASITYVTTDLADTTPGQDLWRYDYTLSGGTFLPSAFFDIYFAPTLYASLTASPSLSPDWDATILQQPTTANLPPFDRGMFDVFALVGNPSQPADFSVSFVYLGPGTPGIQPFDIFDPTSQVAETGFTRAPISAIPEPSTAVLSLISLAACASLFRRRFGPKGSN